MTNPFLFIVQVSAKSTTYGFGDNNVTILVLPSLRCLFAIFCECWNVARLMLYLSVGIELNPGHKT